MTVDHPSYYNQAKLEVIDAIEGLELGFVRGSILKYICRYKQKNGIEDLKKAKWYLNRLIEREVDRDEVCSRDRGASRR